MMKFQKISLALLRVSIGWVMFYAGITKLIDPAWTAAGYLSGAKTLTGLFQWFASPTILPITNFLNSWGLTLIGAALIAGVFVRVSSIFGALLMILYYLPILEFPFIKPHSLIVDEHIIYFLIFILLATFKAGRSFGLENWCSNLPICSKFPKLRNWLG